MKHLKTFESINKKNFWIIPIDQPHLAIALKKIGMLPSEVLDWMGTLTNQKEKEVLIFNDDYFQNGTRWTYGGINSTDVYGKSYMKNPVYKNMGRVVISDEEANIDKYNI